MVSCSGTVLAAVLWPISAQYPTSGVPVGVHNWGLVCVCVCVCVCVVCVCICGELKGCNQDVLRRDFLVVQWLRLHASTARGMCSIAGWELRSRIPCCEVSQSVSSIAQSCPTLCDPMNYSIPGLPVHHQLLEFTQIRVHRVGDAIQPSHPLSSPSPPAPNPSQQQSLFQ